jgi:DNA-directed RNA polymerase specialized sigma24 family protein
MLHMTSSTSLHAAGVTNAVVVSWLQLGGRAAAPSTGISRSHWSDREKDMVQQALVKAQRDGQEFNLEEVAAICGRTSSAVDKLIRRNPCMLAVMQQCRKKKK